MKPNRNPSSNRSAAAEDALCRALSHLKRPDDIRSFLRDLCTPAELQALTDRWRVVRLLEEGHAYRKINELTGVSVTTIGRVARYLGAGNGGYRRALKATNYD